MTELGVMRALYNVLIRDINNYTSNAVESLDDRNIVIDFPSVDMMPKATVLYLQQNYTDYDSLTVNTDNSSMHISVFILCKKDKGTVLQEKVNAIYEGLYKLLKTNPTLDGVVTYCSIESFDYYPAIEGNSTVKGAEVSVNLIFEKEW